MDVHLATKTNRNSAKSWLTKINIIIVNFEFYHNNIVYFYFIGIPYSDVPILPIRTAAQLLLWEKKSPKTNLIDRLIK